MGKLKRSESIVSDDILDEVKSFLQDQPSDRRNEAESLLAKLKAKSETPTHQATEYTSVEAAAEALGIDYDEFDPSFSFSLKISPGIVKALSPSFDYVLKRFQSSPYTKCRRPKEALSRTMLDIILLDRLESLQDSHGHFLLQLNPEVNISVTVDGANNTKEIIRGRMDWALNYDARNPGSILIVWEAKRIGNFLTGMPQLLVYMAGVFESRRGRINQSVFGILSDSGTFQFAFLDHKKKFYTSLVYQWRVHQSTILAYIDAILLDAMHSSPHTTPTKSKNSVLENYQRYLKDRWVFGGEVGDKPEDEMDDIVPGSVVDVFMEGKDIVLRPSIMKEVKISGEAQASEKAEA